jgi:CheY-like chemotaxis protein
MPHYSSIASSKSAGIAKKLDRIHILILDNSTHVTTLFKDMLSEFGFTSVFVANNGFQGVQILREVKINLIITDWDLKLPSTANEAGEKVISHTDILPFSGVEFIKRIRCSPSSPNPFIPVIMFLDTVEKIKVITARDAGINEVCIKPLSAEEFCRRIMSVIDHPRIFITADNYKGPCRRRRAVAPLPHHTNRRKLEVQIIKFNDYTKKATQ